MGSGLLLNGYPRSDLKGTGQSCHKIEIGPVFYNSFASSTNSQI